MFPELSINAEATISRYFKSLLRINFLETVNESLWAGHMYYYLQHTFSCFLSCVSPSLCFTYSAQLLNHLVPHIDRTSIRMFKM